MKHRVLKGFIDKVTGIPYNAGDTYECEKKRFNEIQSKGDYLVIIAEKAAEKANKEPIKALEE